MGWDRQAGEDIGDTGWLRQDLFEYGVVASSALAASPWLAIAPTLHA